MIRRRWHPALRGFHRSPLARTAGRAAVLAATLVAAFPAAASAHVLSGKINAPLPLVAYVGAAAIAVALSFAIVGIADPGPRRDRPLRPPGQVPRWIRVSLRVIGIVGWSWIVVQAIVGGNSDADVASLFLWTYGWVGLALVSALIGPAWSWLDPFSTLHDLGAWVLRRLGIRGMSVQPYPERLGIWPAIAGFGAVIWLELVAHIANGRTLGLALIVYTLFALGGMAQYGKDAWREHGETFSVWFGLLGRVAPFGIVGSPEDWRVQRRPYASALVSLPWTADRVTMVAMGTGSILYDGASQTNTFFNLFGIPDNVLGTLLLFAFLALLAGLVLAVGRLVGLAAVGAGLVPVALGYLVAHYFTSYLVDGQRIVIAISDPLQRGWNLFGTAFYVPGASWLAPSLIWTLQVGAVVCGHVVGAWMGHSAVRGQRPEWARSRAVSQVPLAILMVILTSATLWSLGQNLATPTNTGSSSGSEAPAAVASRVRPAP
jgi:hypothetical protein